MVSAAGLAYLGYKFRRRDARDDARDAAMTANTNALAVLVGAEVARDRRLDVVERRLDNQDIRSTAIVEATAALNTTITAHEEYHRGRAR